MPVGREARETDRVLRSPLDVEVRDAYLRRLGLDAEPPSVEALQRLQRRHVERVPYETLWIHADERWDIDPSTSAARIALQGRGGYCYHLNGALGSLLSSLGYAVRSHPGGVRADGLPESRSMGNHLVLTVSALPTEANPSGVWHVDAGLGDALHEPLPLLAGAYVQEPFHLALDRLPGDGDGWLFTHDPSGGFRTMRWHMVDARVGDFSTQHRWLSTSPESGFVRVAMAERRDATGVDVMRGLVLTRLGERAATSEPLTSRDEWFAALADVFDLRFESSAPDALDALWERVERGHEQWHEDGRDG
jgi:arylamine N-acetyltransferase